jgi:hypothetical protein
MQKRYKKRRLKENSDRRNERVAYFIYLLKYNVARTVVAKHVLSVEGIPSTAGRGQSNGISKDTYNKGVRYTVRSVTCVLFYPHIKSPVGVYIQDFCLFWQHCIKKFGWEASEKSFP